MSCIFSHKMMSLPQTSFHRLPEAVFDYMTEFLTLSDQWALSSSCRTLLLEGTLPVPIELMRLVISASLEVKKPVVISRL
ncbi:MAG: hypothetical protein ACI9BD_000749 [Candidatus Marinamargulisbacteria bacterium]